MSSLVAATPSCTRTSQPRGRICPLVIGLGVVGLCSLISTAQAERFRPATLDLAAARDRPMPPGAILIAEVELEGNVVATAVPDLPPRFRARVRAFGAHS